MGVRTGEAGAQEKGERSPDCVTVGPLEAQDVGIEALRERAGQTEQVV